MPTLCYECDKDVLPENAVVVSGVSYCQYCADIVFLNCKACNCMIPYGEGVTAVQDKTSVYCVSCADRVYFKCNSCKKYNVNSLFHEVHYTSKDTTEKVCPTCYAQNSGACCSCSMTWHVSSLKHLAGGKLFCPECYEEPAVEYLEKVRYSRDPRVKDFESIIPNIEKDPNLFFGLEIEFKFNRSSGSTMKKFKEITDKFYTNRVAWCKPDGSVDIEYNFLPSTKPDLFSKIDFFFEHITPENIFKIDKSCGIHIHIPEKFLDSLSYQKVLFFVNHPTHNDFINHISGRSPNSYCLRTAKLPDEGSKGKYHSVASRVEKKTYEFRLFRSSMSPIEIRSDIEFIDSLVKWAPSVEPEDISLENWYSFIKANEGDFSNLLAEKFPKENDFEKYASKSKSNPRITDIAGAARIESKWRSFYT